LRCEWRSRISALRRINEGLFFECRFEKIASSCIYDDKYSKTKLKQNIQPTAAPVSGKKPPPSRCALSRWTIKGTIKNQETTSGLEATGTGLMTAQV
jgi:hypothetical protein